ncbi:MAG: hypothetical protein RL217_1791 [Pseudomonadota bacterium]
MPSDSLPLLSLSSLQSLLKTQASVAVPNNAQGEGQFEVKVQSLNSQPPYFVLTLSDGKQQFNALSEWPLPLGSSLILKLEQSAQALVLKVLNLTLAAPAADDSLSPQILSDFIKSRLPLTAGNLAQSPTRHADLAQDALYPRLPPQSAATSTPVLKHSALAPVLELIQKLASLELTPPQPATSRPVTTFATTASSDSLSPATLKPLMPPESATSANPDAKLNTPVSNSASPSVAAAQASTQALQQILKNWQQQLPTLAQLGQVESLKQAVKDNGLSYEHKVWQILSSASAPQDSASIFNSLWQKFAATANSPLRPTPAEEALSLSGTATQSSKAPNLGIEAILAEVKMRLEKPFTQAASNTAMPSTPSLLQALLSSDYKAVISRALVQWANHLATQQGSASSHSLPVQPQPSLNDHTKLLQSALAQIEHEQSTQLSSKELQLSFPLYYQDGQQAREVRVHLQQERDNNPKDANKPTTAWQLRLYFDLRHLGELDVDIALHYPKVRATFWSKEQHTLSLLQQELKPLQERLKQMGVEVEELHARYGKLPEPSRNQIRTRWVDERA